MEETQQINACIGEMENLKKKIEALEKQKILNEKNEMLKKTTMRPNLQVFEDWLNDYQEAIEDEKEKINKNATERDIKYAINHIKSMVSMIINEHNRYQQLPTHREKGKYENVDLNELEQMTLSLETEPYNVLKDKMNKLYEIVEGARHTNKRKVSGNYTKRVIKEEIAASHIEATYNMFNIINRRLDVIEDTLGIKK